VMIEAAYNSIAESDQLKIQIDQTKADLVARTSQLDQAYGQAQHARNVADALYHHREQFRALLIQSDDFQRRQADLIYLLQARVDSLSSSRLLRALWTTRWAKRPDWVDHPTAPPSRPFDLSALPDAVACSPPAPPTPANPMHDAVRHLQAKGLAPRVILDVGAAQGCWTNFASTCFPDAEFFMIDPLTENQAALESLCLHNPRFHYLLLGAGRESRSLTMNVTPDLDGSSLCEFPNPDARRQRQIQVEPIDRLLNDARIQPPDLVKIDVQGWELEVLAGGQRLFDTAHVFILEVNLFKFTPDCPLVHEVVAYMASKNYRVFDLAGTLRRPFEDDLGQMDLVFVSNSSPLVASNRWK